MQRSPTDFPGISDTIVSFQSKKTGACIFAFPSLGGLTTEVLPEHIASPAEEKPGRAGWPRRKQKERPPKHPPVSLVCTQTHDHSEVCNSAGERHGCGGGPGHVPFHPHMGACLRGGTHPVSRREGCWIQLNLCFHLAFQFILYGIKKKKKSIRGVRCSI